MPGMGHPQFNFSLPAGGIATGVGMAPAMPLIPRSSGVPAQWVEEGSEDDRGHHNGHGKHAKKRDWKINRGDTEHLTKFDGKAEAFKLWIYPWSTLRKVRMSVAFLNESLRWC